MQAKISEVAAFTLDNVNINTSSEVTNSRTRKFRNRDKKYIVMEEHGCNVSSLTYTVVGQEVGRNPDWFHSQSQTDIEASRLPECFSSG